MPDAAHRPPTAPPQAPPSPPQAPPSPPQTPPTPPPPFVNATARPLPWSTRAVFVVMAPFALLRLVLLLLVLLAASVLSSVALCGLSRRRRTDGSPLAGWRAALTGALQPLMRGVLVLLGFWPWVGLRVVGREHVARSKAAAAAVVCNHVTFVEPVAVFALRWVLPVSAAENARYPLVGPIILALRSVLVDRADPVDRAAAAGKMAAACADPARPPLLVFPEGTAGDGTALMRFRTGVFAPLLPVQPVAVRYAPGPLGLDYSWVSGGPSQYALAAWMLLSPWSCVSVAFLPVMAPTDDERAAAAAGHGHAAAESFARRVAAAIAAALGVPASSYSERDQGDVARRFLGAGYARRVVLERVLPPGGLATLTLPPGVAGVSRDALRDAVAAFMAADPGKTGTATATGSGGSGSGGVSFADFLLARLAAAAAAGAAGAGAASAPPAAGGVLGGVGGVSSDDVRIPLTTTSRGGGGAAAAPVASPGGTSNDVVAVSCGGGMGGGALTSPSGDDEDEEASASDGGLA
jgi:lyso-ornithine lipid O-acyltransferase